MNDTFNHQQQLKCVAWNQNSVSDANICILKKNTPLSSQSFINNWQKWLKSVLFLIQSPNKE